MTDNNLPICVDLDGTLSRTDTLWEYFIAALKHNWAFVLVSPFKILNGKANFKSYLVNSTGTYNPEYVFQEDLLEYLKSEKNNGRKIYLATGSHEVVAKRVANQAQVFDGVFATNDRTNLISQNKADLLTKTFPNGFVYAGNSSQDLKVWATSKEAILVNTPASIRTIAKQSYNVTKEFGESPNQWLDLLRLVHKKQCLKATPLLIPLVWITNPSITEISIFLIGLISFLLGTSALYLARDLLNLDQDRKHPKKNPQVLASGRVEISKACFLFMMLLTLAFVLSLILSQTFFWMLLGHCILIAILELTILRESVALKTPLTLLRLILPIAAGFILLR